MDDAKNLLAETIKEMELRGKTPGDVRYVVSATEWPESTPQWCTWDEFAARADFEYDAGYGGNNIALELRVVGADWWMERHEYDGSEWWEFKTLPNRSGQHNPALRIREYDDD